MKTFLVEFTEHNLGYVRIKADSLEEAKSKFEDTSLDSLNPRYTDCGADIDSIKEEE
jgi:hypothetical protein